MKYYRLGHIKPTKTLKQGDNVCSGDVVGENSTGNGKWAAHVHFDILTYEPTKWTEYVIEKSKEWVEAHYADPRGLEKRVLPSFHHLGYGWLEDANYAGGHAFHSGLDLNGKGSGNDDLGDPVLSPVDGIVRYVYHGTGKNEGWGGLLIIEEQAMLKEFVKAIEKITDEDYGDNINEKEQKDASKKLIARYDLFISASQNIEHMMVELQEANNRINTLTKEAEEADNRIKSLTNEVGEANLEIERLSKALESCANTATLDNFTLTELAGAFFRKLIQVKK